MIAAILHFDDAPEEKGCLRVVPHSHKLGPLEAVGDDHHLPQFPLEDALPIPAKAGDAIFMNYLLVHGSGVNRSDEPLVEKHGSRGQGMMLAGVDPRRQGFEFAWERKSA